MSQEQLKPSKIKLPDAPKAIENLPVKAWEETVEIDTYLPITPEPFPMFFEKRVYQGSSGKVYPLQFFNRIEKIKRQKTWHALHLENSYVRLMILPELGGRIHIGLDKTNDYDFLYRNNVIKPALVGLAGPWISGGIEFNWPQHHRPGTLNPVDYEIEEHEDGSRTVWCSDRDPFNRLSETHGITLRPESSLIEIQVRLRNPTELRQSFLWWANMAVAVNNDYQSFFPEDVKIVADHARRAVTGFPRATGKYYGIDYQSRVSAENPDGDRLDWFKNIPVPTSYMCLNSKGDFFGGYDHGAEGGLVHWADHRISPGKKQWTWGNSDFGRAWDRNLTDGDGPYIELMAGVFTDNQPDFSFLEPGETKSFSQYVYPIQKIGAVKLATRDFAINMTRSENANCVRVGVGSTRESKLSISLIDAEMNSIWTTTTLVSPGKSFLEDISIDEGSNIEELTLILLENGREVLRYELGISTEAEEDFNAASVPGEPEEIESVEELHLIGLHLIQYRHATRDPLPYWQEALRRDPFHTESLIAIAQLEYRLGNYPEAIKHLRKARERLTSLNPNPISGEVHYLLGLTYRQLEDDFSAFDSFAKSTWDMKFASASFFEMAKIRSLEGNHEEAVSLTEEAIRLNGNFSGSRCLRALLKRSLGLKRQSDEEVFSILAADGFNWNARYLSGAQLTCDLRTKIDLALELASAGFFEDAKKVLLSPGHIDSEFSNSGVEILALYCRAWIEKSMGEIALERATLAIVAKSEKDRSFPHGLGDLKVLRSAISTNPFDHNAHAILGNLYYSSRNYEAAIYHWNEAVRLNPKDAISHRNLAIALYNIRDQVSESISHYEEALSAAHESSLLVFERDQLAKRIGSKVIDRLQYLEGHRDKVDQRDDLTLEFISLLLLNSFSNEALVQIKNREFQPWEGGEGQVLKLWERINLHLSYDEKIKGNIDVAVQLLVNALTPPASLGEDHHPLANRSEIYLLLGDYLGLLGDEDGCVQSWSQAAYSSEDFRNMAPKTMSDKSFYSIEALERLGLPKERKRMIVELNAYAEVLLTESLEIDYFATSLPRLLLFKDDPQVSRDIEYRTIKAQIHFLIGNSKNAIQSLEEILLKDPSNDSVFDLCTYMRSHRSGGSK